MNPLTGADGTLLRPLAEGVYVLQGFRNRDRRLTLSGDAANAAQHRRQAATVTRKLAVLRAHGLIVKAARSQRYHLRVAGRRIVRCLRAAHASDTTRLASCA